MGDPTELSATELIAAYEAHELSPVEVTQATLDAIAARDDAINAFVTVTGEVAMEAAHAAQRAYRTASHGAIEGVPYSLKDLTVTSGIPTLRGSRVWADRSPTFDAPIAQRLADAGGVLLGKTTTPELGWKGDSGNRVNGPCRNPWDRSLTAGGSSGGAAAAAAAGFGALHQGTDGAGSIRIPAALCGVVGLKPTFGLVPQFPPSAIDAVAHAGPIARTVRDVALMLEVLAGADTRDSLSIPRPVTSYVGALERRSRPLKIAWSPTLGFAESDPGIVEQVYEVAHGLVEGGHSLRDVDLELRDPWTIIDRIWAAAMAARHREVDAETRAELDPGLLAVIEYGESLTGAEVAGAYQERLAFTAEVRVALRDFDLLACPALPVTAWTAGEDHPPRVAGARTTYLGWTKFTYPFNLTGQPAISLPAGLVGGMPVGLQLVGRRLDDAVVLAAALDVERARPWRPIAPLGG